MCVCVCVRVCCVCVRLRVCVCVCVCVWLLGGWRLAVSCFGANTRALAFNTVMCRVCVLNVIALVALCAAIVVLPLGITVLKQSTLQ